MNTTLLHLLRKIKYYVVKNVLWLKDQKHKPLTTIALKIIACECKYTYDKGCKKFIKLEYKEL